MTGHLSIVIPTFNRKDQLSILLKQLQSQKVADLSISTVVVVDGSTDGTYEMLASDFSNVHVVGGDGNWWFTRSINEGCKYAVKELRSDYILTINDDIQVPIDYLQKMIQNYRACDSTSVIGSCSYSLTKPHMITFAGFSGISPLTLRYKKYIQPFTKMEPGDKKGLVTSVTLPTRSLFISAHVLSKINYFDERNFPQYGSDYDMVFRAAKNGSKIYISYDAYVFENMDTTSQGNPRLTKSWKDYLKNVFFNKYSSNYYRNQLVISWRFGYKILFPLYVFVNIVSVPYVYIKYKYFLNKKILSKS